MIFARMIFWGGADKKGGMVRDRWAAAFKRAALPFALLAPFMFVFCFPPACKAAPAGGLKRDPVIGGALLAKAKPKEKPDTQNKNTPKFILKRDVDGRYSWVVEGPNVWQVIHGDAELRRYVGRLEKASK